MNTEMTPDQIKEDLTLKELELDIKLKQLEVEEKYSALKRKNRLNQSVLIALLWQMVLSKTP